jgi:acetylornithine/N-succinyldiaminopimelate aminotransferase
MLGAELIPAWKGKANALSELCRRFGALVLVAGPDVLRFVPPLTITEQEVGSGLERVAAALRYAQANPAEVG